MDFFETNAQEENEFSAQDSCDENLMPSSESLISSEDLILMEVASEDSALLGYVKRC